MTYIYIYIYVSIYMSYVHIYNIYVYIYAHVSIVYVTCSLFQARGGGISACIHCFKTALSPRDLSLRVLLDWSTIYNTYIKYT